MTRPWLLGSVAIGVAVGLGGLYGCDAAPAAQPESDALPLVETAAPSRVRVAIGSNAGGATKSVDVGAREVTVSAFAACVEAQACTLDHVHVQEGSPCNYAASDRKDHPINCVDWYGAEQYCKWAGGRLCQPDEWFAACRGLADTDYPYGPSFDAASCNALTQTGPKVPRGTEAVGTSPGCEGGYPGLADMVGNVSEWVDDCTGDYCKFYGGSYTTNEPLEDFASCKKFCAGNQKSFRSSTIGIRCCHDDAARAPSGG